MSSTSVITPGNMNKFNSKRTGKYRSKLESTVRKSLPRVKGMKVKYEATSLTYVTTHEYIPDFTIELPSGRVLYIEVKGWFRSEDRRKMASVKRHHPDKDIRLVFSSKNARNAKWCEKHGYIFAIGHIPKEWLE